MRALTLALAALALSACGLIDAFENSDNTTVDCRADETCFCREPDESEEGARCSGGREACECVDGFIGCVEDTPCTIEYSDGGCGALECICDVLGVADGCTCSDTSCTSAGVDNLVRSDLGGGCIGATCECREGECSCDVDAACRLETLRVQCGDTSQCEVLAGAESTGCDDDGDCDSDEVCVVVTQADVGALGYCFRVAEGGDVCPNGGSPVPGDTFGATSAFCPRSTGVGAAVCEGGLCDDVITF